MRFKLSDSVAAVCFAALIAVVFYTSVLNIAAQPQTENLQRINVNFLDITFAAEEKAFIVGSDGAILRSIDNGANWEWQSSGTLENLLGLAFASENRGTIVGLKGTLLQTRDAGETWKPTHNGWSEDLYSVSFGSEKVGVLVGDEGFVAHTADGGASWQKVQVPTDSLLQKVLMISEDVAIALGGNGTIIRSEDAGKSWERIYHDQQNCEECPMADLAVDDFGTVYALVAGHMFNSDDMGKTWQAELSPRSLQGFPTMYAMDFARPGRGVLVGDVISKMRLTSDRGRIYTDGELSDYHLTTSILLSVSFRDLRNGIAVGTHNGIYVTSDGGQNWTMQSHLDLSRRGDPSIQFLNPQMGFIGGTRERLFRTHNGGATWNWQPEDLGDTLSNSAAYIEDLHFFNEQDGVVFTSHIFGYLRTNNGGTSFDRSYVPKYSRQRLDFCDEQFGFFAARADASEWVVRTTSNGGLDWTTDKVFKDVSALGVECVSADRMFLGARSKSGDTDQALILRSNGPGKDWDETIIPGAIVAYDIEFLTQDLGFVSIGYDGQSKLVERSVIFRTDDGGNNWQAADTDTVPPLGDIGFSNSVIGYAVGDKGAIVKTTDGGISWRKLPTGYTTNMRRISALGDGTAFITGNDGSVFRVLPEDEIVSVNDRSQTEEFQLPTLWTYEPYPNPFSNTISIPLVWFSDYANRTISIDVYDMLGNHIEDLQPQINNLSAGRTATIVWEPQDLPSGVYIINFEFEGYTRSETVFYMQ